MKYFWDLYNYAYSTYDTSPITERSDSDCRFCSSVVEQVAKLKANNTRVEGYQAHAGVSALPSEKVGDRALVVLVVTQDAGTAVPSTGTPSPLPSTTPMRFSFALRWDGGVWKIHGVDFEAAK